MSRLDEIKARAEAATKGPWSFDWSEGEVPVFYGQTTKISGTFSVEANTIEDAEFIAAAREDVPWLIECIGELNGAICWDTTCLNCSSLLDSNYDQYMRAEIAEAEVERLTAERDALAAAHARVSEKVWKVEEVMDDIEGSDPTTWERLRDALAGSEADTSGAQPTDQGCGCSTNLARARYADGDPAGCYCTCSDDAREGCEHDPDEHQPTDQETDHG